MTTVASIEAIPVLYPLQPEHRYGSARGLVPGRAATLIRLETSDGVVGWGEAWGGSMAAKTIIEEMAEFVVGQVLAPSSNWLMNVLQRMYHRSSSGDHVMAASALDIAMWDAFARSEQRPIHAFLGGPTRRRIQTYASTGYVTADHESGAFADMIAAAVEEGYTAVKIKLGLGRASDRTRTEIAREAVGPDGMVFVDFNGNYTADQARRSIDALRELDLGWVEEPVAPDDLEGLRLLRGVGVPLACGEAVYTRFGFRDLLAQRLIDVVQPDVSKCGGLSEARVIAHLAQTWNVRFSPHVWGGAISQAASVQLLATVPDYPHTDFVPEPVWFELDRGDNDLRDLIADVGIAREGTELIVPDGPGLGITVDEDMVDKLRVRP